MTRGQQATPGQSRRQSADAERPSRSHTYKAGGLSGLAPDAMQSGMASREVYPALSSGYPAQNEPVNALTRPHDRHADALETASTSPRSVGYA